MEKGKGKRGGGGVQEGERMLVLPAQAPLPSQLCQQPLRDLPYSSTACLLLHAYAFMEVCLPG